MEAMASRANLWASAMAEHRLWRRREYTFLLFLSATLIWLGVGVSLGWYYTFTYYGKTGLPMPSPEPCAVLLLYYFSVLNVSTGIQAVHWLVVFPLAGGLWAASLILVAGRMKLPRPSFVDLYGRFSLAALPLALPMPAMAWLAGQRDGGFVWQRMLDVALRHGGTGPWWWLTPLYFSLGLIALALQLILYRRSFPMPPRKAVLHYPLGGIVLILASCVFGMIAALPLRYGLE